MEEKNLQVNPGSEFITVKEAAELLGCTPSAVHHWLNDHLDIKGEYTIMRTHRGRKKTLIRVDAMPIIANMKDSNRGGRRLKYEPGSNFKKGKREIAKKAIEKNIESTHILQQAQMLLDQARAIMQNQEAITIVQKDNEEIKSRLAELEGDTSKMALSDGQRKRLNERVRLLARETNLPYSNVWRKLHDVTGRRCLEDYVFEDYGYAITWLKKVYTKNRIDW